MKKILSPLMAAVMLVTIITTMLAGTVTVNAAAWNGSNYNGGTFYGSHSFLEGYGIDYNVYMDWLESHENDGYYVGTPYYGNQHCVPNGDSWNNVKNYAGNRGSQPPSYSPYYGHGMNCSGFVWHVLYKTSKLSGVSDAKAAQIPGMSGHLTRYSNYGTYRFYFSTKQQALASGVLEKGDIFWINGSSDWHTGLFWGSKPNEDLYWHSFSPRNTIDPIRSAGAFLGVWVIKITQPDYMELEINTNSTSSNPECSLYGTRYAVFNNKSDAAAASNTAIGDETNSVWSKRIGSIVTDSNGKGSLKDGYEPAATDLWYNGSSDGVPNTSHSYWSANNKKVSMKNTYYAVEWSAGKGYQRNKNVYEFKDSGKRTSTGYKIYSIAQDNNVILNRKQTNYVYETPELEKLKIHVQSKSDASVFGSTYCVFDSQTKAEKAAKAMPGTDERMGNGDCVGTITANSNGDGWLKTGETPSYQELASAGDSHEYFSRKQIGIAKQPYYLVQYSAPNGYVADDNVYKFEYRTQVDNGKTPLYKVELKAIEDYRLGDVNCDGKIDIKDVTELQKYICDLEIPPRVKNNDKFTLLDMDQDNRINIIDATILQKYVSDIKLENSKIGSYL